MLIRPWKEGLLKDEGTVEKRGQGTQGLCWFRPRRWSIFRAMQCRWFIFQQRCDADYFLEKLNIAIVAIIFLDHREQLFFDYFAHLRTDYFGIIHDLPPHFRSKELLMSSFIRINLQTDSVKCVFIFQAHANRNQICDQKTTAARLPALHNFQYFVGS